MTSSSPSRIATKSNPFRWRPDQQWEGYLFLLPSLLGFTVFVFLAVGASLGISFLDWGLTGAKGFAGLGNYRELLRDPVLWRTFANTVFYIVTIVPLQLALGLVMAVGNVIGSQLGSRLALKHGSGFVRKVFLLVVTALILKTAWDAFAG